MSKNGLRMLQDCLKLDPEPSSFRNVDKVVSFAIDIKNLNAIRQIQTQEQDCQISLATLDMNDLISSSSQSITSACIYVRGVAGYYAIIRSNSPLVEIVGKGREYTLTYLEIHFLARGTWCLLATFPDMICSSYDKLTLT